LGRPPTEAHAQARRSMVIWLRLGGRTRFYFL
jgi:hypothetical protein